MDASYRDVSAFAALPSLQEALKSCERDVFMAAALSDCFQGFPPSWGERERCIREAIERVGALLDALCEVAAEPFDERLVLLPEESFSLDVRSLTIRHRVTALRFDLSNAGAVERARWAAGSRASSYADVKRLMEDERARVALEDASLEPETYALEPHGKVLGCKIWIPERLDSYERGMMLASAFWELSFYELGAEWMQRAGAIAANSRDPRPMSVEDAERSYCRTLAQVVAVLNHNARIDLFDEQLALARRWGWLA